MTEVSRCDFCSGKMVLACLWGERVHPVEKWSRWEHSWWKWPCVKSQNYEEDRWCEEHALRRGGGTYAEIGVRRSRKAVVSFQQAWEVKGFQVVPNCGLCLKSSIAELLQMNRSERGTDSPYLVYHLQSVLPGFFLILTLSLYCRYLHQLFC